MKSIEGECDKNTSSPKRKTLCQTGILTQTRLPALNGNNNVNVEQLMITKRAIIGKLVKLHERLESSS